MTEQLTDKDKNAIQQIVKNAKNSPMVQTLGAIFGLVEKKGEEDER